jgi:hypothetical protein
LRAVAPPAAFSGFLAAQPRRLTAAHAPGLKLLCAKHGRFAASGKLG